MLREIESITAGDDPNAEVLATKSWLGPLELVPALTLDNAGKGSYLFNILASKRGFQSLTDLILQHPYLFWRVPINHYQASLSVSEPDRRIFIALDEVIEENANWDGDGTQVMKALLAKTEPQGIDQLTVHNVLRLIGAGGEDVVSQSSSRMFMLLGKNEWKYRLNVVRSMPQV